MLRRVLCTMLLMGALPSLAEASQGHISVVLLGATGDLAKKYLWQGLFQLYIDQVSSGHSFTFHGAALTDLEPGQKLMFDVLKKLACPPDESPNRCAVLKDQFLKLSQYHQLKTSENYTALNREIEMLLHQEGLKEAGRIFYFSVPPFAYTEIARHINNSCRPPPGAWLRVVLEKPFGHDLESAQQMAAELMSFFREEEMYRVDHYLGKQVRSVQCSAASKAEGGWESASALHLMGVMVPSQTQAVSLNVLPGSIGLCCSVLLFMPCSMLLSVPLQSRGNVQMSFFPVVMRVPSLVGSQGVGLNCVRA